MAEAQMVDPHDVMMTGENSFIRLSNDGGATIVERVSHWRVLWSPAGQGHALFIEGSLTGKGPRVYADNPGVARYLQRTIETLLWKEFADESLPVIPAGFSRGGDSLSTPPGAMNRPLGVYSTFIPARSAQLSVNGRAATARVFPMERFGRPASSCCLAWSESWTRPRG
jgi:hypothetical protein